jgi:hypothetical protein
MHFAGRFGGSLLFVFHKGQQQSIGRFGIRICVPLKSLWEMQQNPLALPGKLAVESVRNRWNGWKRSQEP